MPLYVIFAYGKASIKEQVRKPAKLSLTKASGARLLKVFCKEHLSI